MEAVTLGIILGGIILTGFLFKKYALRNQDYWKIRGVTEINKDAGWIKSMWLLFTGKKSVVDFDTDAYNELGSERFGGAVEFGTPALLIKDPELIKAILVKDFDHFVDRRKMELHSEPVFKYMVSMMEGTEWKSLRSVISPTFTTGKIRRMFQHFNKCGNDFVEFINSKPVGSPGSRDIVVKEAFSRFLVDVIGSTTLGMEANCLKESNSIFYKMSKRFSDFSFLKLAEILLALCLPFLTRFGLAVTDKTSLQFFENICKSALRNRENSQEKREDFLQMMIEAKRGELKTDEGELEAFEKDAQIKNLSTAKSKVVLSDEIITAQCLLFFLAGMETTGSVLCFAVYYLALLPDIQAKLYEDVSKAMNENGGQVDYETIAQMQYMDKFLSEVLRLQSPGNRVERRCVQPYKIPNSNVTVEKDSLVYMTVTAMHRDPNHFSDPEKFNPERFAAEEKSKINPYTYMPFGQGPRNCLGMRFALMEAKIALAYLVYNFKIEPTETTPVPLKVDPTVGTRPPLDLELRFKTRQQS